MLRYKVRPKRYRKSALVSRVFYHMRCKHEDGAFGYWWQDSLLRHTNNKHPQILECWGFLNLALPYKQATLTYPAGRGSSGAAAPLGSGGSGAGPAGGPEHPFCKEGTTGEAEDGFGTTLLTVKYIYLTELVINISGYF